MHNQLLNTNKIIPNNFSFFLPPFFLQLIQIFLNPFISSLFLCKPVQLFCFLLSFWDQSGSFTFLSFLISSRWILIFSLLFSIAVCQKRKSSSSVCLMVRSALSFLFIFFIFYFFFVRLLCKSLPLQLPLYPLCFIFFPFCAEML